MKKTLIIIGIIIAVIGGGLLAFGIVNSIDKDKAMKMFEVTESFTDVDIDIMTADLNFKPSDDGKVKVKCVEKKGVTYNVSVKEGTLVIEEKQNGNWFERIFDINFTKRDITVYLPTESEYGDLMVKASTGDISIPKAFSFDSIDVELSTGDVTVRSTVRDNLRISGSTSSVRIESVSAKEIEVGVSTGDVELKGVDCGSLKVTASTGDVTLTETVASGKITVNTSTGDVEFENVDAESLSIKTSTGDVYGTLKSDKNFYCETDTGSVNVPHTDGGLCEIKTSTGDISISIVK